MDETKALLASRTFWGAVVAGASGLMSLWGYSVLPEDQVQLVDMAATLVGFAGSGVAIWGRVKAGKRINGVLSGGES